MKFNRTGIILYTLQYEACVQFYRDILELKILFEGNGLTCFAFGDSYLLVELDDEYDGSQKEAGRIKTCLRMNVPDVKALVEKLRKRKVEVNYLEFEWGAVAKFFDPDGNLCAFRDSETFEKQVAESVPE